MQRRQFVRQITFAAAVAAAIGLASPALAQTTLKFSHTDQPGGARQKAAEMFAQKV
jgi:TRAP-type C4-dicarboxylate transport system substrate-binding protein